MYEWNEGKRATNLAKHRVDFAIVEDFDWSTAVVEPDLRFDYAKIFIERLVGSMAFAMP